MKTRPRTSNKIQLEFARTTFLSLFDGVCVPESLRNVSRARKNPSSSVEANGGPSDSFQDGSLVREESLAVSEHLLNLCLQQQQQEDGVMGT